MGAGTDSAGEGFAGYDVLEQSAPRPRLKPPAALVFDGETKDFLRDDEGRLKSVHPVDAAAFALLRIRKGAVTSAPDVGETVSSIKYIDEDRLQSIVEDRVRLAWAPLLTAKKIAFLSVQVNDSEHGRIFYTATYENLITKKRESASGSL